MKVGFCYGNSVGYGPCMSQCQLCAERYGPAREIKEPTEKKALKKQKRKGKKC